MSGSVDTVRPSARFLRALAVIAILAFALRIGYVSVARGTVGGDGRYYHAIAGLVVDGKGFIGPEQYQNTGVAEDSAPHPPAWPAVLIAAALVGLRTTLEQQIVACLVGTATVVMVGFAGRRIAGGRVGLVAAAIAAVYPNMWLYEREIMSETLALLLAATVILLAYRFHDRPTRWRAIALGIACGILGSTHAEQLLLIVVMLVPLVLLVRSEPLRRRVAWAAMAVAAAVAVLLPWAIFNSARFDAPVLLGTEFGVTVTIANCQYTYEGAHIGFQDQRCNTLAKRAGKITGTDEVKRDNEYLHYGLDYVTAHTSRLPVVVLAREARTWGLMPSQLHLDTTRGTGYSILELGYVFYLGLIPFAIAGAVLLRRRRIMRLPLFAFFVSIAVGVALTYGYTRFRAASEVVVVILAAVGVEAILEWIAT